MTRKHVPCPEQPFQDSTLWDVPLSCSWHMAWHCGGGQQLVGLGVGVLAGAGNFGATMGRKGTLPLSPHLGHSSNFLL